MIASIQGILESGASPDTTGVVVNVGGVSLLVHVPASTMESLGGIGGRVRLYTYLYFKEDNLALYGFSSPEERELFQMLIGVERVGPRGALSMLSAMRAESLAKAIASEDVERLTQVPGVGKKLAARLILELKGKLEKRWGAALPQPQEDSDVLSALISLGYSPAEARTALSNLAPSPNLPLEERIRLALQHLGSRS
ncbi:MAG: Holliday junction branch migration protein RuvA [Chloroflexi bacterium]|nr:Holliday junction branch migration protein RuvA [Chloroflexota bacterium]